MESFNLVMTFEKDKSYIILLSIDIKALLLYFDNQVTSTNNGHGGSKLKIYTGIHAANNSIVHCVGSTDQLRCLIKTRG